MRTVHQTAAIALALILGLAGIRLAGQQTVQTEQRVDDIRRELLQLPYYGVFDFLAFSYDKGMVSLMGYAYEPTLRKDAERAVKRVAGVDQVTNKIEELPVSPNDDEIRWRVYYGIYRDPFLSRYAPGGAMLWGHTHPFGPGFRPLGSGPFAAFEAAGNYPIHIIVNRGHVTLMGVVDNASDKQVAGMKASQVPNSFSVDNQLVVEKPSSK